MACIPSHAREVHLRAARNTFVFPGMAGVEVAMRKGHGEMETGGERKEVGISMGRQGVSRGR